MPPLRWQNGCAEGARGAAGEDGSAVRGVEVRWVYGKSSKMMANVLTDREIRVLINVKICINIKYLRSNIKNLSFMSILFCTFVI